MVQQEAYLDGTSKCGLGGGFRAGADLYDMFKCTVKVDKTAKTNRPQYAAAGEGWRVTEVQA